MNEGLKSAQQAPLSGRNRSDRTALGIVAALSAFGLWAIFPLYFNQFGPEVSAWEILLHRVIWAQVFLLGFVLASHRLNRVITILKQSKTMLALAASALVLGVNWATFIWAVTHAEILQSSLGYYINPLLNVFLGYSFLKERLRFLQRLAVAIAAAGVLISLIGYGEIPWLALIMAGCFGLYGLIRKQIDVDSITGLTLEVLMMLPIAAAWLVVMTLQAQTAFLLSSPTIDLLLVGGGLLTILPLILFVIAAKRLKLATVGLMQYIAPTGHFLLGVFLYGEPFTAADAITFGCIWIGLALYSADMWVWRRSTLRIEA
jgi:chloramphenicol-sensitive protein RarD